MSKPARSRVALWISGLYFILAFAAWLLPLLAGPGESLSAIYLILVAQPWATLLVWGTDTFNIDSFAFNMAFMLGGVLLNTWILYRLISLFSRRRHGERP